MPAAVCIPQQRVTLFLVFVVGAIAAAARAVPRMDRCPRPGCIHSVLVDRWEEQSCSLLSRATFVLLDHNQMSPDTSAATCSGAAGNGVLEKLGRDWTDLKIMQNTCAHLVDSTDIDHELMQHMLGLQLAAAPTFHRTSLLLSYIELLVAAGQCLDARAVIVKFLCSASASASPSASASAWCGKFVCKDMLNCVSSCVCTLHSAVFISLAWRLGQ